MRCLTQKHFTYPESKSPSSLANFGANLRTFIAVSVPRNTYIRSGGFLFVIFLSCLPLEPVPGQYQGEGCCSLPGVTNSCSGRLEIVFISHTASRFDCWRKQNGGLGVGQGETGFVQVGFLTFCSLEFFFISFLLCILSSDIQSSCSLSLECDLILG